MVSEDQQQRASDLRLMSSACWFPRSHLPMVGLKLTPLSHPGIRAAMPAGRRRALIGTEAHLELQQRGVHDQRNDGGGRWGRGRHCRGQPGVPPPRVQHQPPRRHVALPQRVQDGLCILRGAGRAASRSLPCLGRFWCIDEPESALPQVTQANLGSKNLVVAVGRAR